MSKREQHRPATDAEILEERARKLARPMGATAAKLSAFAVDMLTFRVGGQRFAIESRYAFAVLRLFDLVPLPGARRPVVGLTRWRGDVLTLLDLRRMVGVSSGALDDLGRVIVVGDASPEFGVLADSIDDIVPIDPSSLFSVSHEQREEDGGGTLVSGVTADAIHVVDAAALIARQTGRALSSAAAAVSPFTPYRTES
jgi:purine-binding chemotaxis protein CheW